MMAILQLHKQLKRRAELVCPDWLDTRVFQDAHDVACWLGLRQAAFADQQPAVRPWTEADFAREMTGQPWWRPERMWLTEVAQSGGPPRLVGSPILTERGSGASALPALHWLMVSPEMRGRGVAACLLAHAEAACWDDGRLEIVLETHAGWLPAVRFYERHGYEPIART